MWMGFGDQQRGAGGPAAITTFAGDAEARLTTARPGDYFGRAGVQHVSQVTLDLATWYEFVPYENRLAYMFRRETPSIAGQGDPAAMTGPAFVANDWKGAGDADANVERGRAAVGHPEMGHTTALHRAARTSRGTPLHIRLDGPGYDAIDLPRGTGAQPKLQFSVFVPTSEQFRRMRDRGAAKDLADEHGIQAIHNGLEAFTTTTRRQNFLVPPRARRAFPLAELV
jgi:hypothetical protein